MKVKEKNLRKGVLIASIICTLIIVGFLGSYAYFIGSTTGTNEDVSVQTGSMELIFSDGNNSFQGALEFSKSATKTFTIRNNGTENVTAKMNWSELVNTYLLGSLTYTLSYSTEEEGTYTDIITDKNVPQSSEAKTLELANNLSIPAGETYYYKLTITLNYLETIDQTSDLNAILSTQFSLEETDHNTLVARASVNSTEYFWEHSANIKKIVFETSIREKENTAYTYDISSNQNKRVMGRLVSDSTDSTKYILYIQADGDIKANENSSYLFRGFTNLESIEGMEHFDTSMATNMSSMFQGCSTLLSLDLSNFDTSNVTDMRSIFNSCNSLTSLNLSGFNTINVTNMGYMFMGCSSLTSLNVSNFDTSNVTNMSYMFSSCSSLTSLDLSNFNTGNVTDMSYMFQTCRYLTSENLSNFDTGNVTDMRSMFNNCSGLTSLNLSGFNTSNVTNMSYMFQYCNNLTSLDLSNFNTNNVTNMQVMFYECSSLKTLDVSNFNTNKVTNMSLMFYNCNKLTSLDLNNFDTSNVSNMSSMFHSCCSLTTSITIRGTKCTDYAVIFYNAATANGAKITVNYTSDAASLVNNMITAKSSNSNVIKGSIVAV